MSSVTVDGPPEPAQSVAPAEQFSPVDATLARAELAFRTGRAAVARRLYDEARKQQPSSPAVEFGLGMLALSEGDRAGARQHLERSLELDPSSAEAWLEYALFERESGASRARVEELLRKAAGLNPSLAEARFMLGVRATDDGRLDEAVDHLRQAVRVLPRQSSFWHALAFALEKLGQRREAADAARNALRTASTVEEESMARALSDSLR
jgi:Flp pilus assembly protein TadD